MYQPPHLRRQIAQSGSSSSSSPTVHLSNQSRQNVAPSWRPQPTRKDWTTPSLRSSALASPAEDIQPMRRNNTPKKEIDQMDLIQSVSRSGGDGSEGDTLKDWTMQERYRGYINERLDKHYATYSRGRHVAPPGTAEEEIHSLESIVLLFRKLREGVVASHRVDEFALEVFESSARLSILTKNTAQLISSLSGLVPGLYTLVDPKGKSRSTGREQEDEIQTLSNTLSEIIMDDNRAEFTSILLLFHLTHTKSRQTFHNTLMELTAPSHPILRQPFSNSSSCAHVKLESSAFISISALAYAIKASKILSEETFDPIRYLKMLEDETEGSPYERIVLSWAAEDVRERAWRVLSKTYLECEVRWAGRWCGYDGGIDVGEWVKSRGGRIDGAKIKTRG